MLRFAVVSLVAATALAGCEQDSKKPNWKATPKVAKQAVAPKVKVAEPEAPGPSGPPGSVEERLAKLERRVGKIAEVLKQAGVRPSLDDSYTYAVPVDPLDPVVGPKNAKVTIVEAYEFMCPYCAVVAPMVDQLAAEYPKDVRVVSKYFLIHGPPASPSGQAACAAAKQGKYDEFQKALWKKAWPSPQEPNHAALTAEALPTFAGELGMNPTKFKADMDGDCKAWVDRSMATLQQFGAGGTPSFYINGRFFQGNNAAAFKRVIDEEIKKVDESGIPAAQYYDKVVVEQGQKEAVMISPLD